MEQPPAGGRHFVSQGPSRRWMVGFCSLLALAVVAAMALTYVGIKTVRGSRAGRVVSAVTDPTAPGFEAFLEPTPTLAILQRNGGSLSSIAVLSLNSGDVGGSLLLVSPEIQGGVLEDSMSLAAVAAYGLDPLAAMPSLQAQLGFGITEAAVVDDARWAELVAPVAPLQLRQPHGHRPVPRRSDHAHGGPGGPVPRGARPGRQPAGRGRPAPRVLPSLAGRGGRLR